jgi:hypothetical protein
MTRDQPHALGVARARMRKPSCLISCSQSGLGGGAVAGEGKQGSMRRTTRLLRRNMMLS